MKDYDDIIRAQDLRVERGGATLIDVPELSIRDGEVLSLIGPNGAGKTTLLQALCFLLKPLAGEILFRGRRVGEGYPVYEYRRKLAMVFQEPLLFDTTVFANVSSGLRFRGMKKPQIQTIVSENLERFGIGHLSDRSARTLSGGEAQRTSLARAFATNPEVILLDEPFASLDLPTKDALIDDLEKILRSSRTTTVLATHDRTEALRLSTRIAVMTSGKVIQIGPPTEVMNHPASEFVASFVGVETILAGTVKSSHDGVLVVSVAGSEIEAVGEAHPGSKVLLCIRPENVLIARNGASGSTSARNVFRARITKIVSLGPYQKIRLDCGFPLVAYITHESCDGLSLQEGADMTAIFKATAVHVIRGREE